MNMGSVRELTKEEVRSMPAGSVTTIKDLMFMGHLPTGEGVPPGGPPQDAAASPGTPLAAFGAADAVPWGNEPIGFYDAYAAAILQARGDWLLEELHRTQVQLRELVPGARLVPAAWRDPSPLTAGPAAAWPKKRAVVDLSKDDADWAKKKKTRVGLMQSSSEVEKARVEQAVEVPLVAMQTGKRCAVQQGAAQCSGTVNRLSPCHLSPNRRVGAESPAPLSLGTSAAAALEKAAAQVAQEDENSCEEDEHSCGSSSVRVCNQCSSDNAIGNYSCQACGQPLTPIGVYGDDHPKTP